MIGRDLISWTLFNNILTNYNLHEYILFKLFIGLAMLYNVIPRYYQNRIMEKIIRRWYGTEKSSVTLEYNDENERVGSRYIAVSEYINQNCKEVKECKEIEVMEWNDKDERKNISFYQVSQYESFPIDNEKDLHGEFRFIERNESGKRGGNGTYTKTISRIIIFSYRLTVTEITEWIDDINQERLDKINEQFENGQYIIKVTQKFSSEIPTATVSKFKSTATFGNTYSPFGEKVKNTIDFFNKNKEFYEEKGMPYTLGIAAVGIPGGGKTRLLKQLLNYTKRHAVYIELSDNFNMDALEQIMHGDIRIDLHLDPSQFIVIFEDIDTFTDSINARIETIKDDEELQYQEIKEEDEKKEKRKKKLDRVCKEVKKSSLGKILNIFDGVNERDGGMVFVTTNHPEKLDKAFLRAGRCDLLIKCDYYTKSEIYQLCKHFWKEQFVYTEDQIRKEIINKYTGADLYEIFKEASMNFENIKDRIIESKEQ
jgi:SpoVK/Ycf46/Vps4 family AAA+-type ATPase